VHSTPGAIPVAIKISDGAGSQARPAAPTSQTNAVQQWGGEDGPGGLISAATAALSEDPESCMGAAS